MMPPVVLVLAEGVTIAALGEVLTGDLGCEAAGPRTDIERTFYDTFDGRFFRAGLVVEYEHTIAFGTGPGTGTGTAANAPEAWLRLRELHQHTARRQVATVLDVGAPLRPGQLADPRLSAQLEAVAGRRALLPVVTTTVATWPYRLPDRLEKAIVRLSASSPTVTDPATGAARALEPTVTVSPVRGAEADFERLVAELAPRVGERPASDPLLRAARAIGFPLGIDPADTKVTLDPAATAAAALAALLDHIAAVLDATEAGCRARLDEEFLHDFRVATRRARTLVWAAKGVIAEEARAELGDDLRWLSGQTSMGRDLDVLAETVRSSAVEAEEFAPLWEALGAARDAAHADCLAALDGPRYRQLRSRIATIIRPAPGGPSRVGGDGPGPAAPVTDWADAALRRARPGAEPRRRRAARGAQGRQAAPLPPRCVRAAVWGAGLADGAHVAHVQGGAAAETCPRPPRRVPRRDHRGRPPALGRRTASRPKPTDTARRGRAHRPHRRPRGRRR